ncbi:YceI family protein [bacterium]|nr:YceI family protein [bacterium]
MKTLLLTALIAATTSSALIVGTAHAESIKPATPLALQNAALSKGHTQIFFAVDHQGFSKSMGMFVIKQGTVSFSESDWSKAKLDVTIDVGSLRMGSFPLWDEHMSEAKFFNTKQFPEMRFVSTKASGAGKTGTVTGNLTLLGVSKPVTLNVTLNKIVAGEEGVKAGFSATGSLRRSDFGMSTYLPDIGDQVEIRIETEASSGKGA